MKINTLLINILLAMTSFLVVFTFKQIEGDLKSVQTRISEIQVLLREIQVKQESYVTEARVRELMKEYHDDLRHSK